MRTISSIILVAILLLTSCKLLKAQATTTSSELDELKSLVLAQQRALEDQQTQIQNL